MSSAAKPIKLPLLAKLLETASRPTTTDNEALLAIRKAGEHMLQGDTTWEELLAGKVTIIEDPFSKIAEPPAKSSPVTSHGSAPKRPFLDPDNPQGWTGNFGYSQPPTRPVRPSTGPLRAQPAAAPRTSGKGQKRNDYQGYCFCCGDPVGPQLGYLFRPNGGTWAIACTSCNGPNVAVPSQKAKPKRVTPSDIASMF